jgi:hypothetical protein
MDTTLADVAQSYDSRGKKKAFKYLGYYSEWPKVAGAVIKAIVCLF